MTYLDTAKRVLERCGGIAKTADFAAGGVSATQLAILCRQGVIHRVQHGWYEDSELGYVPDEQKLAAIFPEAVICMESALFHYGYSDFAPQQWCVAIPRSFSSRRLQTKLLAVKPYYIPQSIYELGVTNTVINGVSLRIYDRERTICDCFKHKTRMDKEMFNSAVLHYVQDSENNIRKLVTYVNKMKLTSNFHEIMGVLLHG